MGFGMVPVYQGQGGTPEYYPDFISNAAGVSFKDEGREILSPAERDKLLKGDHSSMELKSALRKTLQTTKEGVEIVLLAPPADLVQTLSEHPELRSQIKRIHVMGG